MNILRTFAILGEIFAESVEEKIQSAARVFNKNIFLERHGEPGTCRYCVNGKCIWKEEVLRLESKADTIGLKIYERKFRCCV
jgi:hypothetical protein